MTTRIERLNFMPRKRRSESVSRLASSVLEHKGDLQAHAVFGVLPVLRDHLLTLDPGSGDVLKRLVRASQTPRNGVVKERKIDPGR